MNRTFKPTGEVVRGARLARSIDIQLERWVENGFGSFFSSFFLDAPTENRGSEVFMSAVWLHFVHHLSGASGCYVWSLVLAVVRAPDGDSSAPNIIII